MSVTLLFCGLLLPLGAARETASAALQGCGQEHQARFKVRMSQGAARGVLLNSGKYEDADLRRDAPKLKGNVHFHVLIDGEGKVACADVLKGDSPMLNWGALELLKTVRFSPYLLNGKPVFVETKLRVHAAKGKFKLVW